MAVCELRNELVGSGGAKASEEQLRSHSQDRHESKQSPCWHSPKVQVADHRSSLLAALTEGSPQGHLRGGRQRIASHSPKRIPRPAKRHDFAKSTLTTSLSVYSLQNYCSLLNVVRESAGIRQHLFFLERGLLAASYERKQTSLSSFYRKDTTNYFWFILDRDSSVALHG